MSGTAGASLLLLLAVWLVRTPAAKCPGEVRVVGIEQGGALKRSAGLSLEVNNASCIGSVVYRLNDVDVAESKVAPYKVSLDPGSLPASLQGRAEYDLNVFVKDSRSHILARTERVTITFAPGADAAIDEPAETPQPAAAAPQNARPEAASEGADVAALCEKLSLQISRTPGPDFSPAFVARVKSHLGEYGGPAAFDRAQRYYREINKAFRDVGYYPLVGYVLAMSRSNFEAGARGEGRGLWQIPAGVARSHGYLSQEESEAALEDPKRSAEIAALYTKALFEIFDDKDFPYAVACFGMSLREAGEVRRRLLDVAPDPASHRDVLKMMQQGIINEEQAERLARFYAAGLMIEHPQAFGLKGVRPLSTLF